MRSDQVIFLQAAKNLTGGLDEALSLLSFAHAFAGESREVPKLSVKKRKENQACDLAGEIVLSLLPTSNGKRGRKIDPKSVRQRVFTAIDAILTQDGEMNKRDLFARVRKLHPDLTEKQIAESALACQGIIRKYGVWSVAHPQGPRVNPVKRTA